MESMFKATEFEFKHRYLMHTLIFVAGFCLPWNEIWGRGRAWALLALLPYRHGWLGMQASMVAFNAVVLALLAAGAGLRVWGTSYIGVDVVNSQKLHGAALAVDGPYRRMRNPLYLGTWLHVIAISFIMRPLGALFTVLAALVMQLRLVGREEPFLRETLGEPYVEYCQRVPRWVPSLVARVPVGGARPQWARAVGGEIYFVCVAACAAALMARYGTMVFPEHLGALGYSALGSLGLSMVADGVLLRGKSDVTGAPLA
jgi:protein-S-isoprenylcysteine O-methyltransferase Ste14